MGVKIVTDSTSDLPAEICRELDVTVVPLTVMFGDQGYRDGVDLGADEFYKKLIESDKLPTTSQPSAGAFAEAYKEVAKETDEILSIHISGKLSQTYNSARLAASEMDGSNVEVMDSLQVSLGLGEIVIAAARAAKDGASMEDLKQLVTNMMPGTRTLALLETLEYLAKGGRIGKVQAFLGNSLRPLSILKVIPIVEVRNGEAHPFERVRTRRKGLDRLIAEAQGEGEIKMAGVAYSTNREEAESVLERLRPLVEPENLLLSRFGPVLGTHLGPGALGLGFSTG